MGRLTPVHTAGKGFRVAVERTIWGDRFNRPTVDQLRKQFKRDHQRILDRMRKRLLELDGGVEAVEWMGEAWKWSLVYRTNLSDEPLAVLIPSTYDLQLAVPLDPELAETLAGRKLKRTVREGLDLAREPFNTNWGVWSLNPPHLIDDLQDLVARKLAHLSAKAVG